MKFRELAEAKGNDMILQGIVRAINKSGVATLKNKAGDIFTTTDTKYSDTIDAKDAKGKKVKLKLSDGYSMVGKDGIPKHKV